MSRDDIGAIRILKDASFVEIREAAVKGFLAAVGPDMTLEKGMVIERLMTPPKLEPRGPRPDKPRFDKPKYDKPKPHRGSDNRGSDAKPRDNKDWAPKGDRAPYADKPASKGGKPKGTTTPVDWNDAPAPKAKKPKSDYAKGGNPKAGAKPDFKKKPRTDAAKSSDGAVEAFKPRKPNNANDPSKRVGRPGAGLKGPKPPAGKASSKKNKARKVTGKPGGMGKPTSKNKRP